MNLKVNRKQLERRARKTQKRATKSAQKAISSEGALARSGFFAIGAAGMIGGFIHGRRRGSAALRYAGNKAKGAAASVTSDSSTGNLNDPALARKVESEIFREVQRWFALNGWNYPSAGAPIKGVAAVQQFFEGMGVSKPPIVQLSRNEIRLTCKYKETARGGLAVNVIEC